MSFLALMNALSAVLVPLGIAGSVMALACAVVAALALARGAAGLAGGAIGLWIVGAVLSMAASFASQWMPSLVALTALAAAIVLGVGAWGIRHAVSAHHEGAGAKPIAP